MFVTPNRGTILSGLVNVNSGLPSAFVINSLIFRYTLKLQCKLSNFFIQVITSLITRSQQRQSCSNKFHNSEHFSASFKFKSQGKDSLGQVPLAELD